MKKKITSFLLIILVGVLIFTGCGFTALKGGPAKTDPVTSNGGLVVQKGNYLYYVSGYTGTDALTEGSNKYGNVKLSAIYRSQLNADGTLKKDEEGNNITEVLAPKVVGFENGGFYIFGDKIYYATPNTEKGNDGKINFEKTDFYESSLDGTNVRRLYKTAVGSTKFQFAFYQIENEVYLAVYDSADLYVVRVSDKKVNKVATGVSSAVLPRLLENNTVEQPSQQGYQYIYYTRSIDSEKETDKSAKRGNILAMANIVEQKEIVVSLNSSFTVKDFKNDTLIFTKRGLNEDNACYYMADFEVVNEEATIKMSDMVQLSYQAFSTDPIVLNFEDGYRGMIIKNESGYLTYIKMPQGGMPVSEVLTTETALTPIAVYNNYVFAYNADKELYMIKYNDPERTLIKLTNKDNDTLSFDMKLNVDFNNGYVYFYKSYTGDDKSAYYLVRVDATRLENFETELVGTLLKEHIKTEE